MAGNWLQEYQRAPLRPEFWDVVATCLMTTQYLTAELDREEARVGDTLTLTLRLTDDLPWCSATLPRQRPCVDGFDGFLVSFGTSGRYRVAGDLDYACDGFTCDPVLRYVPATDNCTWAGLTRSASCTVAVERRSYPPETPVPPLRTGWYVVQGDIRVDLNPDPLSPSFLGGRIPADAAFYFHGDASPPETGTIVVVEETVPPVAAQDFSFSGSGTVGEFSLDTDPASATPDRQTFTDLAVGSYTVAETVPDGWRLSAITCVDPSSGTTTNRVSATATIGLAAGETVTCTFLNAERAGLVVNSESDAIDDIPGDGVCDTSETIMRGGVDEPECTLRAALEEAAADAGADTITFDIPGGAVPRITPLDELPAVAGRTAIDATTQPGGWVELSGADAGTAADGLELHGRGSSVRGLVVNGFDGDGIVLAGEGEHVVSGNRIGTNAAGTAAVPNRTGIHADYDGTDVAVTIGGERAGGPGDPCKGDCNLVSGNRVGGVKVAGGGSRVIGNFVGTDVTGAAALGNGQFGVFAGTDGQDRMRVYVGGPTGAVGTAPGNLISGNPVNVHADYTGYVQGNLIGTDRSGTRALGGAVGVRAGQQSVVGVPVDIFQPGSYGAPGRLPPQGNVISGHRPTADGDGVGVLVEAGVPVAGNYIGTTSDGASALGNQVGISVPTLGSVHAAGNVISGNTVGVSTAPPYTDSGVVRIRGRADLYGNRIGTDVSGTVAVPNGIGVRGGMIELGSPRAPGSTRCDGGCNLVSGNTSAAVVIGGGGIQGNFVGTDVTGTQVIPNGSGLRLETNGLSPADGRGLVVGGPSGARFGNCGGPCNLIAGNHAGAISAAPSRNPAPNTKPSLVQGNVIGQLLDGRPASNGGWGVLVSGEVHGTAGTPGLTPPDFLLVGGDERAGEGNLIRANRGPGVLVSERGGETPDVTIRGNAIFENGGLGIDNVGAGQAVGQVSDTLFQAFPTITSARRDGSLLTVHAHLEVEGPGTYVVDLYGNRACDPIGYGQGEIPLASRSVVLAFGADFSITVDPAVTTARAVTLTATGPDNQTSEFSACVEVREGAELTAAAPPGATRLEVSSSEDLVGKVVAIGEGATAETNYGVASGSLLLARPTRFAHAAGETVVPRDDTLFVSLDKAVITRAARLPDTAVLAGRLRPIAGRAIACGEDVTLTLDGNTVAQRVPGTRFVRQSGNRCVFVARTENGIGRLELDLAKGTWNAEVIRRDLEKLTNPVDVGLAVGDDAGSETLDLRQRGNVWTYVR